MTRMSLNRVDIEKLVEFLKENDDIQNFTIIKSGEESGIGYIFEVETTQLVNNRPTHIRTELTGVETW